MRILISLLLAFLTTTTIVALDAANSRYCCHGSGYFPVDENTAWCCNYYRTVVVGSDKPQNGVVNGKKVCGMRIWGNMIDHKFDGCCKSFRHTKAAAWGVCKP